MSVILLQKKHSESIQEVENYWHGLGANVCYFVAEKYKIAQPHLSIFRTWTDKFQMNMLTENYKKTRT